MKLISEQKIYEAKNTLVNDFKKGGDKSHYGSELSFRHGFLQGVHFSETEFQNLAIEYSEWLSTQRDYKFCKSKNVWTLYGKAGEFDLTSKQLFDKFIEQRNKA